MAWTGAITSRASNSNGTTGAQTLTSSSFTPTASSTLFVFAVTESNDHTTEPDLVLTNSAGLTFTRIAHTATADWNGFGTFTGRAALWSASIGGSPASMTVTVDPAVGTSTWFTSLIAFDVTGSGGIELTQALVTKAEQDTGGNTETHASTALAGAVTTGNLALFCVGALGDSSGATTTPTDWTSLSSQSQAYAHAGVFYRSNFTGTSVSVTDLGEAVGASFSVLAEWQDVGGSVDVNPAPTIVTARPAVANVGAQADIAPSATIVTARPAVANVGATANVDPAATVVAAFTAIANVAGGATAIDPAPTVVAAFTAVAALTATANVDPAATVVNAFTAVASIAGTANVDPAPTLVAAFSAVADVTGHAGVTPAATVVAALSAVAALTGQADVDPAATVVAAFSTVAQLTSGTVVIDAGPTVVAAFCRPAEVGSWGHLRSGRYVYVQSWRNQRLRRTLGIR